MKQSNIDPREYPGLPQGAFHFDNLPPQAVTALGTNDPGVWSAAVNLYVNTVDPATGETYNGQPLSDVAEGSLHIAASNCRGLAIEFSSENEKRAEDLEVRARAHLASAIDQTEHASSLLNEPLTGPNGEKLDGHRLQALHRDDERLAQERSTEGDSRHTEQTWASGWRIMAATLLGLLDVLLLWKPLLNLSFESSSGSVFRWAIGAGLAGLQVLGIEWSARVYVNSERISVDRRGAMGDYNRPLKTGRVVGHQSPPERDDLVEADRKTAQAYRALVLIAAFIAIIGGVRVAVLGKRADLAIYEAALFGTIIGLILGALVVQMARLYCRGNLLGDRLRAESEALDELNRKIQHARGIIAGERESALAALDAADLAAAGATRIRNQTVSDYWRAIQLAWTWFGLPHSKLDYGDFEREALPVRTDSGAARDELRVMLDQVNQWLGNRPTLFTPHPSVPLLGSGTGSAPDNQGRFLPLQQPPSGQLTIVSPQVIALPAEPEPPHLWMFAGAALTLIATVATAFLAPGPATTDQTALPAPTASHLG